MPKRIAPLSELQISKAKPKDKQFYLFDGFGLYLIVVPTGGKLWRFKYLFNGRRHLVSFGVYPYISLVDARKKREDARGLLAKGIDPFVESTTVAKIDGSRNLEAVAREWHGLNSKTWSANHAGKILGRLEKDIFSTIGECKLEDVSTPRLAVLIQDIAERSLETAHRLKIALRSMYDYAVIKGYCQNNPAASLRKIIPPVRNNNFAAPITEKDLKPILVSIDAFEGSAVVKAALRLAPLLFVRPGELRGMLWSELDFNQALWEIPAARMKMNIPHVVPLCHQAVAILQKLQYESGHSAFVFPSYRTPLRCMSDNAVNAALRRLGFDKGLITGHGFRATARTMLDEILHFPADVIEHQLAHVVRDPLGRAYNRTTKLPERKAMMQAWADYLDTIKKPAD